MGEDEEVTDRYIEVQGVRTHFVEAGEGTPLVLVHGMGGPLVWQNVVEPLSRRFHVIRIDLPGFGESDCPPAGYSTRRYAEFLASFLDTLDIHYAMLAGISYGGQIAATLTGLHSKRVVRLVLINSTGLVSRWKLLGAQPIWTVLRLFGKHVILPSERLSCWFSRWSFHELALRPNDLCGAFHRQVMQPGKRDAWLNALRNVFTTQQDFTHQLAHIVVPTLIVWGSNDRLVSVRSAAKFQGYLTGSMVWIIDTSGHSTPLEKPNELAEAIVSFHRTPIERINHER